MFGPGGDKAVFPAFFVPKAGFYIPVKIYEKSEKHPARARFELGGDPSARRVRDPFQVRFADQQVSRL